MEVPAEACRVEPHVSRPKRCADHAGRRDKNMRPSSGYAARSEQRGQSGFDLQHHAVPLTEA